MSTGNFTTVPKLYLNHEYQSVLNTNSLIYFYLFIIGKCIVYYLIFVLIENYKCMLYLCMYNIYIMYVYIIYI